MAIYTLDFVEYMYNLCLKEWMHCFTLAARFTPWCSWVYFSLAYMSWNIQFYFHFKCQHVRFQWFFRNWKVSLAFPNRLLRDDIWVFWRHLVQFVCPSRIWTHISNVLAVRWSERYSERHPAEMKCCFIFVRMIIMHDSCRQRHLVQGIYHDSERFKYSEYRCVAAKNASALVSAMQTMAC